jgi:hypothetical protein
MPRLMQQVHAGLSKEHYSLGSVTITGSPPLSTLLLIISLLVLTLIFIDLQL